MDDNQRLTTVLTEFARTMVTDFPIQSILDHLVERIVEVLPISSAGVTLIAPGTDPRYVAASDDAALRYERLQSELGEGPCLLAYRGDEPVVVSDLRTEDRFPDFAARALTAGLAAVFTFPLRHGDRRLGALDLYRDTPGPMAAAEMAAAGTLADVTAAYLLNAQARADLQELSDLAREASLHDPLTGLPNRILLMDRLEHALGRSRRSGTISAVLFIDLDDFKAINDSYGHAVGDELLTAVADRTIGFLRPGDTVARLSGDEFVVLCEDLDTQGQAFVIADRLAEVLAHPFQLDGIEVRITASIGTSCLDRGHDNPKQTLRNADLAMYRAKGGRAGHVGSHPHGANAPALPDRHRDEPDPRHRGTVAALDHAVAGAVDRRTTGWTAPPALSAPGFGPW